MSSKTLCKELCYLSTKHYASGPSSLMLLGGCRSYMRHRSHINHSIDKVKGAMMANNKQQLIDFFIAKTLVPNKCTFIMAHMSHTIDPELMFPTI